MKKSLQIALISGGFALAGVALSQLLAVLRKGTNDKLHRLILLRQKHDELGQHFIAAVIQVSDLMDADELEEIHALSRNIHAEKMHLLCRLYFPDAAKYSSRFLDAGLDVYHAMIDSYDPNDERPCVVQAADITAYKEARSDFFQARDLLIKAIQAELPGYAITR